jgi:hypothetical protein
MMPQLVDLVPVLLIAGAIVLYLACLWLRLSAQSRRIQMAETGKALLAQEGLPPTIRDVVEMWLDHAFGMRGYLLAAVVAMPFATPIFVLSYKARTAYRREMQGTSQDTRALFDKFEELTIGVLWRNNPILTVVVLVETLIAMTVTLPLYIARGMFRRLSAGTSAPIFRVPSVPWLRAFLSAAVGDFSRMRGHGQGGLRGA